VPQWPSLVGHHLGKTSSDERVVNWTSFKAKSENTFRRTLQPSFNRQSENSSVQRNRASESANVRNWLARAKFFKKKGE